MKFSSIFFELANMLSYKFLLCCMLLACVSAQIVYVPVTEIVCQDYTTYEECINGDALACAWCDSTQQCGTCNYCTGDLYLISDTMCPGEISECSKPANCIGGEFVMFSFATFLILLILCGTIFLTKLLIKEENILLKICGVICFIYTLIGLAVLIGGAIVWVISIFYLDKNYEVFVKVITLIGYYIASAAILGLISVIVVIAICCLIIIFIVSSNVGKEILSILRTCLSPCGEIGNRIYDFIKYTLIKCSELLIKCLPCWKTKINSAFDHYDDL